MATITSTQTNATVNIYRRFLSSIGFNSNIQFSITNDPTVMDPFADPKFHLLINQSTITITLPRDFNIHIPDFAVLRAAIESQHPELLV